MVEARGGLISVLLGVLDNFISLMWRRNLRIYALSLVKREMTVIRVVYSSFFGGQFFNIPLTSPAIKTSI